MKLQNVERALRTDERSSLIQGVRGEVRQMEGYLRALLEEYEGNYKAVSLAQSVFEAQLKHALDGKLPQNFSEDALPPNAPWLLLERLPRLADLLKPLPPTGPRDEQSPSAYAPGFLDPLDAASELLRRALAAQLS